MTQQERALLQCENLGSQRERGTMGKIALKDPGPETMGLSSGSVQGGCPGGADTKRTSIAVDAPTKQGETRGTILGFALPPDLQSPSTTSYWFTPPKSKLAREFEKYTLFCMGRMKNRFQNK